MEITLDIENDFHDTKTRKKLFLSKEKKIWNGIKVFKWK